MLPGTVLLEGKAACSREKVRDSMSSLHCPSGAWLGAAGVSWESREGRGHHSATQRMVVGGASAARLLESLEPPALGLCCGSSPGLASSSHGLLDSSLEDTFWSILPHKPCVPSLVSACIASMMGSSLLPGNSKGPTYPENVLKFPPSEVGFWGRLVAAPAGVPP